MQEDINSSCTFLHSVHIKNKSVIPKPIIAKAERPKENAIVRLIFTRLLKEFLPLYESRPSDSSPAAFCKAFALKFPYSAET